MNIDRLRILHVLHDVPYPPRGGGRVDMWGRLKTLRDMGHSVEVAIAVRCQPSAAALSVISSYAERIWTVPRHAMRSGFLKRVPFQVSSRYALRKIRFTSEYDIVLLEAESVAPILDNPYLRSRYSILRTHNIEAEYFRELSRVSGDSVFRKAYNVVEYGRYRSYSEAIMRRVDAIWWVSLDEMRSVCEGASDLAARSHWLPHFYNPHITYPYPHAGGKDVLFLGALSSPQNVEAIAWYFDNVHSKLLRIPEYRFVVAGSTNGRALDKHLAKLEKHKAFQLFKDVSDLRSLYASCRVFANPVLHGAGVNSKTIHAVSEGLPIVTTTPGYRGTGLRSGKDVLVAESPAGFAEGVESLLNSEILSETMVGSAQQYLADHYDQELVLKGLINNLMQADTLERT